MKYISQLILFFLLLGCSDDNGSIDPIENPTLPDAAFSSDVTTLEEGGTVSFSDDSENATGYEWTFEGGNPANSTSKNQDVVYDTAGMFTVSLKVTNADGADIETKTNYITVNDASEKPETDFTASETTIAIGSEITFTDQSTNEPTSWEWEFEGGDPATSTDQNPITTYNNSGIYEVKLIATNSAGSDEEIKTGYIIVGIQTASYTVTFKGNWTAANHPTDFPTGSDHFSSAVGMVHKEGALLFEEGELATNGVEDMAELGNNSDLNNEIEALIDAGQALNRINGGGLGDGNGETTFTIEVNEEFPLVTLVSMIAPSPDWFIAVENVELFDSGAFVENLTVNAASYDSGTDSGSSFNSANDDTDPADNITFITEAPLGNGTTVDPTVAIFTFTRN